MPPNPPVRLECGCGFGICFHCSRSPKSKRGDQAVSLEALIGRDRQGNTPEAVPVAARKQASHSVRKSRVWHPSWMRIPRTRAYPRGGASDLRPATILYVTCVWNGGSPPPRCVGGTQIQCQTPVVGVAAALGCCCGLLLRAAVVCCCCRRIRPPTPRPQRGLGGQLPLPGGEGDSPHL